MKTKVLVSGVLIILLATTHFSCKKDEEKTAPTLPPESTFIMDMSDFSGGEKSTAATHLHYLWAVANVSIWNTILTVNLAVPVASFREAFNHEAVYDPATESWVWSYNVTVGSDVYLAELHGSFITNGVNWEMYVTKNGSFSDFEWYSGQSNLAGTEGSWILKNDPVNNQDFIKITWHKNTDGSADIKYENVLVTSSNKGTYIVYGINNEADFNAFYNIFYTANTNLTEIKWHRTNQNGRVKDPGHYSDSNWHCWDGSHADVVCE
ncbi:MAG TPA: hypothetical protein PLP88_01020 [Bacteroidales bacterium]|nr:hypothetical protein [Bacteroidales bacterium]